MEIRHIIGIIAAVGYVAFTQRERLKTLASAAFARLKPIAGSGKAGWLVAAVIGGVTFWPDVSGYLPDFGKADQIEALEQTIVNQDNQIRDLSERNQWQAEQIENLLRTDPLTKAQEAQRAAEVAMLRDLASDTSPNTQQKLDKVVGLRDAIRLTTQSVYTDAIAEAVFSNSLPALADEIEGQKQ